MKKETIGAIIFGILLGGVLAIIIISKNKERQLEKNKSISPQEKTTPVIPSAANLQPLEISEPKDGFIFNKNTISIKGSAVKNALIVIQSPTKDVVFKNDKVQFSIDFPLAFGENVIKIVVYPKDPQFRTQEKKLKVFYLDEQL